MKLCVFQGTFNPIHKAHLKMAEYVLNNYSFDKILFIPAYKPPHKDVNPDMCRHRYKMAEIAVKNNPSFDISDIEFKNEGKSYSYNTVCQLYKEYPIEGKINFIIGTDAFEKIETWYDADKFKDIVEFIVFVRENDFDASRFTHLKDKGYKFSFAKMDFTDISSTELREKIKHNKPVSDIITKETEEYIKEYGLYQN